MRGSKYRYDILTPGSKYGYDILTPGSKYPTIYWPWGQYIGGSNYRLTPVHWPETALKREHQVVTTYKNAKRVAKHPFWLAKSKAEKDKFAIVSPDGDGVFRIAKQLDCTNQDVIGENCVRNGELAVTDDPHTHTHSPTATPSSQCVCNLDQQSTQQDEMHHCWDAESYWWGSSLAGKKTGAGCFQQWYDPSRLGGELYKSKGNYCAVKLADQVMKLLEWVRDSSSR